MFIGVAVSADNVLYFADGTNIRMMDRDGIVTTVIGNHMHKSHWKPIPCEGTLNVEEVIPLLNMCWNNFYFQSWRRVEVMVSCKQLNIFKTGIIQNFGKSILNTQNSKFEI